MKRLLSIVLFFAGLGSFAQAPTATITVASGTICSNSVGSFSSATSNTPTAFTWTTAPSTGVTYAFGNLSPNAIINFRNAGVYSVSLTVSNSSGTVTTVSSITVLQAPTALFSASLSTSGFPGQLNLTNFSTNASAYLWSYSDTGLTDNTLDASHTYTMGGSYSVSLVASNANGCTDTASYSFYINDSSGISLPNVFTPNGDGINDVFKPISRGITTMKVDIFTRWGNYVYGWDTPNGSWDGHTISGSACVSGQYFYIVEATGFDGKTYKLHSVLTLINDQ
jgi:gliding motility-associated-like protein